MILADEAATAAIGQRLARQLKGGDVVTLSGGLGVGKTTLVRHLLAALGHEGEVPSPSFAIVQPYDHMMLAVWHADLYRIEHPSELAEIGLDSIGDEVVLLVEWPERAGPAAWPHALRLTLEITGPEQRRLTAQVPAAWEGRWPPPPTSR
ncbi:MAG: tRNA (adenosine(37)-N6)-threonylcarbamoyltransferase complex ATPase subunit type 1 TsaE [Sphingomonas bacterium]|nr:tRNA (adenosine(37)-N6)-threonylcarbamoyltransferase complex ATPase subunit type 1 TsaE [Sphingomonas bacterium]